MEELGRKGLTSVLYSKVKKLAGTNRRSNGKHTIKNGNGELLTEPDNIKNRWKEYVEILYDKVGKPESEDVTLESVSEVDRDEIGPELLTEEIIKAIKGRKENKAVGVDEIQAEFW